MGRTLKKIINFLLVLLLVSMSILVLLNFILRYFFNTGLAWSEELARYFFMYIIFIGAISATATNEHLRVNLFVQKLPQKGKVVSYILGNLLIVATLIIILYGSFKIVLLNLNTLSPSLGIPLGYVYTIGLIASFCMILILTINIFKVLKHPEDINKFLESVNVEDELHTNIEDLGRETK